MTAAGPSPRTQRFFGAESDSSGVTFSVFSAKRARLTFNAKKDDDLQCAPVRFKSCHPTNQWNQWNRLFVFQSFLKSDINSKTKMKQFKPTPFL